MSISTAAIVKDCNILAGIYFIFLKKHPIGNLKVFQYQNLTSVKSRYQVRQILVPFANLVALILG